MIGDSLALNIYFLPDFNDSDEDILGVDVRLLRGAFSEVLSSNKQ